MLPLQDPLFRRPPSLSRRNLPNTMLHAMPDTHWQRPAWPAGVSLPQASSRNPLGTSFCSITRQPPKDKGRKGSLCWEEVTNHEASRELGYQQRQHRPSLDHTPEPPLYPQHSGSPACPHPPPRLVPTLTARYCPGPRWGLCVEHDIIVLRRGRWMGVRFPLMPALLHCPAESLSVLAPQGPASHPGQSAHPTRLASPDL